MKVRKRTKGGKSLNMKVVDDLKLVARDKEGVVLMFSLDAHGTEFSLRLSYAEAARLENSLSEAGFAYLNEKMGIR